MSTNEPHGRHEVPAGGNEKQILHRTETGELHSYSREELGIVTASSHAQVRSAAGFLVLAVFLAAVSVFSVLLVAGPASRGQDPMWSGLFLTDFVVQVILQNAWDIAARTWWVFPACIFPFVVAWAGYFKERKAERLRRARNLPRPAG